MRIPIALAIYVSLSTMSFADTTSGGGEIASEWRKVYDAGFNASQHHNYDQALTLYKNTWETAANDEERGAVATDISHVYRHLGRVKEAAQWFERARQAWVGNPDHGFVLAASAANLADSFRNAGEYDNAERILREALAFRLIDANAKTLVRNNLADLLREEGRGLEAEPLFQETLSSPAISPQSRANALIGLADIARHDGAWQSSMERWNEALEITRRENDPKSEAIALRGLAMTWLSSGSAARAEPLLRRSLQMLESAQDTPPEQIASVRSSLGELYRAENKLALAEDEWSRALQIDRKALGEEHPQVAWLLEMLSDVFSARGEFSLARDYATRASQMMRGSFGENSLPVAAALTNRALVEVRASDFNAAAQDYEQAIGIARTHPESRSMQAAMIKRYSDLLKVMHRGREARELDLEARSFRLR
jgi:tetratricopeptide (TPR) repeat protein